MMRKKRRLRRIKPTIAEKDGRECCAKTGIYPEKIDPLVPYE
jgi:hypothetical protein